MELLERLEGLLGDEKADMKNYIQILDAGFEEIKIGVLPATADQVMIGDYYPKPSGVCKSIIFHRCERRHCSSEKGGRKPVK